MLAVLIASMVQVFAQGAGGKSFINGEAIITVNAGTPRATVDAIAANANATVVYAFGTIDYNKTIEAYHLRATNALTAAQTQTMITSIKGTGQVLNAVLNQRVQVSQGSIPSVTPNDPRFNEQWDKMYMKCPQAWTLEKGSASVAIAVIDTGVDITHPDFQGRLLPGIDSARQTTDPTDKNSKTGTSYGHGTHVTGIAAAQADNGIGIAGVAFQNVKILPIAATDDTGTFPTASLIRAFQYMLTQQTANAGTKYVINLSLGADVTSAVPDLTDPASIALIANAKAGAVIAIAAGNNFQTGNSPHWPALLAQSSDNIICVASSNHLGGHAYYSTEQPYTTIAAPGGDFNAGKMILSTWPVDSGSYQFEQGTSMASPQIAGCAALLLSVQGVSPGAVKSILTSTAQAPAGGVIDIPTFGAGIVDLYAALQKVAIGVTIISPAGTGGKVVNTGGTVDPVETLRPEIRVNVLQFSPDQLTITVDNVNIPALAGTAPGYTIENIQQTVTTGGVTTPVRYDAVIRNLNLAPGNHTINAGGSKVGPPPITGTDTRNFAIQPHLWPQGRSMVSMPYYEFIDNGTGGNGISAENVIGTDFRFARWLPQSGLYAFYTSYGLKNPLASFTPGDTMVTADGDATVYSPLGVGFFADFGSAKPVLTHGQAVSTKTFTIPLKGNGTGSNSFISWNMIGDPFNFDVPFAACLVDVGGSRISVQEAANRGLILPTIYSYDPAVGYTYRTLPDGTLKSWAGHWIGVTSGQDIKLVVPPAAISRKVNISKSTAPVGTTWTMQLGAHSKSLHDANNVIGVGGRAAETYDLQDVPKPPLVGPYVGLALEHKDWGNKSGLYAQDIRSNSSNHSWSVVVTTDQVNSDVTVNWASQSIPRNTKVSIKDEVTGQVYDMRTRASLTFNSGADAAARRFTLTARPASQDAVHISNVAVRSGRASGVSTINFSLSSDASYDVKIVSATGATVNNIASRAAAAGNVSLVWQGRDNSGKNVAPGTYLVQIKATGTGGDSVNVVYPFAVVR